MKTITEEDINRIESELKTARARFENMTFESLDAKLAWVSDYATSYILELESRFLTREELENWVFLPNEIRLKLYLYFPEHGLNMANYSQKLNKENQIMKQRERSRRFSDIISLRHND